MQRAKIVCTLGPAVDTAEDIQRLVEAGMDVARLNMSHGTHDDHRRRYDLVRQASDATGHGVGIIADLQGPKIRLGEFPEGKVRIAAGDAFTITTRDIPGDKRIASTTSSRLSIACGFSILAMTGSRTPSSRMIRRTSSASAAERTNDSAM